jgi:AraC-like DNA-binding protein
VVSGMSVRSLQRLFGDYVGVSPKWVMRRARLHEAALRADGGEPVDWAALAIDLGYADQAHLTREFTATIGVPPSRYRSLRCSSCCFLCCFYAAFFYAAFYAASVRTLSGRRPDLRASRMAAITFAGWVRISRGVNGRTRMPRLPIRRCRSSVRV